MQQGGRCPCWKHRLDSCSEGGDAIVWRGDAELNPEHQGVVVLGTPLGHEKFVRSNLAKKSVKHVQFVEKMLLVPDPLLRCNASQLYFAGGAPLFECDIRKAP